MRTINNEIFIKALEKLNSLDTYFILAQLNENQPLPKSLKVDGHLNLLQKKQFINQEGKLTDKAIEILAYINDDKVILKQVEEKNQNFSQFCQSLFTKLENKVIELGEKKTFKNPSTERLLPSNVKELSDRIKDFMKKYNYTDLTKIEEELLQHVEKCIKKPNKYQRSVYYFIFKDKFPSELLKALTDDEKEEEIQEYVSIQKFI